MKKGQYQYLLFIYGLIILIIALLFGGFLFSFKSGTDVKTYQDYSSLDINFLNYLRTPVTINGLGFSMGDLIVYSYYTNDFNKLDEQTHLIFNKFYGEKCSWEVSYSLKESQNFHIVNNLGLLPTDSRSAHAIIPGFKGENIKVELKEKC
ncbi:hypothetical protein HYT57_02505 [Candidatus Woesearchaeota archaeon]|nr:hypothetical protein [Candidatus Woesearchaeota archaeon]